MFRSFAIAVTLMVGSIAPAQAAWTVKDSAKGDVQVIKETSSIFADMRFYKVPNDTVYALNAPDQDLLPVYDFIACLQLTNPDANIEVDHGGGYDIQMDVVDFPGGRWDVQIRLREADQINELDKYKVYLVDRIIIGTLRLRDLNQRVTALRTMSNACYAQP
ncbi:hypothetical protein V5T82_15295 [Magnetovibrio sp. PR-2]|uniref:hypothetical protein n=1 Tax=Magnetovibrio sp. PR-2 TaxID=3120356 RepID=UPI002FCE257A